MKIVNEQKKVITIKELDITDALTDLETGEIIELNDLIKGQFANGDCVKVIITRVCKEEE